MTLLNPVSFGTRFIVNFAPGYSDAGVGVMIAWLRGKHDVLTFFLVPVSFGVVFGPIAAAIAQAGMPVMGSPIPKLDQDPAAAVAHRKH